MPTQNISKNFRIHYIELNPEGHPTVLLLHGLGVNAASWQLQFTPLESAGFRVLAPDMRGFGNSNYSGKSSVKKMSQDMVRLLNEIAPEPVSIVGISMGGLVALQLALDAQQCMDRLILISTFARIKPNRPSVLLYFIWRLILVHLCGLELQARIVAKRLFPHSKHDSYRREFILQLSQANIQTYRAIMRSLARFNVQNRLGEIKAPTLVLSGEIDTTIPLENQRQLLDGIPNARHILFPYGGHALPIDQSLALNAAIIGFLTSPIP